jgi:hypothetical protein
MAGPVRALYMPMMKNKGLGARLRVVYTSFNID